MFETFRLSIRAKLTLSVALVATIGLSASACTLVWAVEGTVVRALGDADRAELDFLRAKVESGVPVDALEMTGSSPKRIRIVRPDGSIVETTRPFGPPELGFAPRAARPGESVPVIPPGVSDAGWSVVEVPILSPQDGPLTATLASPLTEVQRSTETLTKALLVGIPLLVVATTWAAWLLLGRALSPVGQMTKRAANIANATTSERLAVPRTNDELAELASTLNRMLDRLTAAAARQREFISDASHELRSPIAATRTLLEVALASDSTNEPALVRESLVRDALAETLRLEALVLDLLVLARIEEGHAAPRDEVDLDDLVIAETQRASALPTLPIETRGVSPVKVWGDRKSLARLVRNLLENAARHARSEIVVTTRVDGADVVLAVDDDGPGVPLEHRARVFERFTRLGNGRSHDDGGAGLGLALVQRIVESHGGAARIDESPKGGARFEARIPIRRTPSA